MIKHIKKGMFCFFILIFILIFSTTVNAIKIGVSPGTIVFNGRSGNEICNDIEVYTGEENLMVIDLKWSKKESRKIGDYKIQSDDIGIDGEFDKEFVLYKSAKKEICLIFDKQGEYNGLLIVRADGTGAAVGVWIKAAILKGVGSSSYAEEKRLSWKDLQENIIKFTSDKLDEQGVNGLFILANFELILMLFFLVLTKKAIN